MGLRICLRLRLRLDLRPLVKLGPGEVKSRLYVKFWKLVSCPETSLSSSFFQRNFPDKP